MPITYRVGVDIGGTFTDIVVLGSDGSIHTKKVSSSVDDYARAIVDGLGEVFSETGLSGAAIEEIRHGTTVASNAILEHKGARVGLITTKGFRDVLEIRTLRMPRLYDLAWTKPPALVERYLRKVVDERIDHKGHIERALDPADGERAIDALHAEGVEAIAICLINSFANPAHELAIKDIAQRKAPHIPLSVSYEVLPEIKEYERTSTTVINAYVMPIVASYLRAMRTGLDAAGIPARLLLMQSNGGLTTDTAAIERPMNIIESGPAGGVVGAQALARAKKLDRIITFDMGGTTAKASMVENGEVVRAQEYAVGAGIMIGSRLLTGAGYTLKVPAIDLAEVGAGGGSHVWIDAGGALQIGPESAGASPGPVCYDQGGTVPTVTDASVLLGYINPQHLVGGALKLNAERARAVFTDTIAKPLKMTPEQAAFGAHQIAASNMIRAIKAVSTERGRDPREFALFAFGGNGPLFAAGMAAALGISRIVVPPSAGLFSSFGLLVRGRGAPLLAHLPAAAARRRPCRDRPRLERAVATGRGSACHRGFLGRECAAQTLGRAPLQGPDLRACRPGAGRPDRYEDGRASRGSVRPRARAHIWSSRRAGGAGRAGFNASGGRGPAPRRRRPGARDGEPRRAHSAAPASRLFRRRARLDGDAGPAPLGPLICAQRSADHRGIRRNQPRAARRARRTRRRRQHRHRACLLGTVFGGSSNSLFTVNTAIRIERTLADMVCCNQTTCRIYPTALRPGGTV